MGPQSLQPLPARQVPPQPSELVPQVSPVQEGWQLLQVLSALAKQGRWVTVFFGWRPNLPDEADNHLIELALAGNAAAIVTHNVRDVRQGELQLGNLHVLTPAQCLEKWR